ncbi:META domain-containing protein [Chryseobacterium populi]|uniref:Heat shock protein n=1 Tax=Chryseobacterium populi TaxID=1144316 RepID=J3CFT6_9FLAO|nr:META domain-containing protein [Chryseobacterium populi]EJL70814.1 heat shock protein [Chryseobacterium populi]
MKKIFILLLAILFLGIILNCSSAQIKNKHIQREWMLVSFGSFSKDQLIKNRAGINLTAKIENGKIRGGAFMGCNKMFFNSEFKNNGKVKITGVGSTLMACEDMNLETSFTKSFEMMTKYSVEGHFLTLSDNKGNSMKFVASDWD